MNLKKIIATELASKVKDKDCIGLGTGTTAEEVVRAIGERIKNEGIQVSGVSTSIATTALASELGIKVLPLSKKLNLSWGYDGADEIDPDFNLLKGRGGALLKEKIIANILPELIIVVTEEKLVSRIGEKYMLPVEVVPAAASTVEKALLDLGANEVVLRTGSNFYGPLFTESGNLLLDVRFKEVSKSLVDRIKLLTGVVEHGFFESSPKHKVLVIDSSGNIKPIK